MISECLTRLDSSDGAHDPRSGIMSKPRPSSPPDDVIAAFRSQESKESVGTFVTEDGFDAATVHVLAAWQTTEHVWVEPRGSCPDRGMATPAAWRWLVSGWTIDYAAVAFGADVSFAVARAKMDLLVRNRLVYPDGKMSQPARASLQAVIRAAWSAGKEKKDKKPPTAAPPQVDKSEAN